MTAKHQIDQEYEYLNLARRILDNGKLKGDRTGTGTLSLFGPQCQYDLRCGTLPLLTTKRVFWRGVVEELLWFIKGSTDSNQLKEKKISIWDANGTKEFLQANGLGHREEGDLGPIYGFQWRHSGAKYIDKTTNYNGQGIDQLQDVIKRIRGDPNDRRLIIDSWNPSDIPQMALPPCHCLIQFYVIDGELSCKFYQRSADVGLGVPFNIASYALLTHMIAHITNLKAGDLIHTMGDAHIYLNHIDAMKDQLMREPKGFPKINFKRSIDNIEEFSTDDIELIGYDPHDKIQMKMSV